MEDLTLEEAIEFYPFQQKEPTQAQINYMVNRMDVSPCDAEAHTRWSASQLIKPHWDNTNAERAKQGLPPMIPRSELGF